MGKSFEIRPTGVAHAELKIPTEYVAATKSGAKYPKASGKLGEGKSVEHYSWKKVTTNVSGFIVGSPTIDHYGDMTVSWAYMLISDELTRLPGCQSPDRRSLRALV